MRASALLFALALPFAVACQPGAAPADGSSSAASSDDAAVRKSIDEANARFTAALGTGDTAGLTANYADDAEFLIAGAPSARGRAAIGKAFSDMLSQAMIMSPKLTTDDLIVKDDIAVETGHYEWMIHPKTGAATTEKGKYIAVWRRQADGSWKIIKDISNTDAGV